MAKQQSRHTQLTTKAAGRGGRTEVPIAGGRRLDVKKGNTAIEIERSPNPGRIRAALKRLQNQPNARKELRVPQPNLDRAAEIAGDAGIKLTVTNLSGTKRKTVGQ